MIAPIEMIIFKTILPTKIFLYKKTSTYIWKTLCTNMHVCSLLHTCIMQDTFMGLSEYASLLAHVVGNSPKINKQCPKLGLNGKD